MAAVDLQSTISAPTASATWDVLRDDYRWRGLALLPPGRAWPRFGLLGTLVQALTDEFSRVARRARDLVEEADPRTTRELLTDWERVLGLPDCSAPTTLQGRRDAATAKLRAALGHDQSSGWWVEYLASLGLEEWSLELGHGPFAVGSGCTDKLGSEEWPWVWTIVADPLDAEVEELVECAVSKQAAAETLPVVHWRWNLEATGTAENLYGVAVGAGWALAVGDSGVVRRSDGSTWSAGATTDAGTDNRGAGYNDGVWIVGGLDGDVYRSTDHGASWSVAQALGSEIYAVDGVRATIGLWALAGESADPDSYYSDDAGVSWKSGAKASAVDVYGATHETFGWVQVGAAGFVQKSANAGVSWTAGTSGVAVALRAVHGFLGTFVAVGDSGTILRSTNGGTTWSASTSGTTAQLLAVVASTGGETARWVAAGAGGIILESTDDGVTWEAQVSPTTENLRAACIHGGRVLIVGDAGVAVRE